MRRQAGFSEWGRLLKWLLVLGLILGGFLLYRANRERISRWMNKPLHEMVPEAEPAPPSGASKKEAAFREEQGQRFEEARVQAEASREERLKAREEKKIREEQAEQELLQAVEASRYYLDQRATLKAQGMDPWSDPDTCRCIHESDTIVSRSETRFKARSRYTCQMEPKRDAHRSQGPKEWVVEIDASFEKDPSGTWQYLGPKP